MILDELVLQDFGAYRGRQTVALTPASAEQPVVLVGGLNGCGKTTLLDAIQLVLYGRLARCSGRGSLAYEEYLRRCMHKTAKSASMTGLELEFRRHIDGAERVFRVCRYWSAKGKGPVREELEVFLDGALDPALTAMWQEHLEEFFPSRISPLFFFDGEKIAEFADVQTSADVLSTAVHALLGLDIIDQLSTDLMVLERRKRLENSDEGAREEVERQIQALADLRQKKEQLTQERAGAQTDLGRCRKKAEDLEVRYAKEGGLLMEQRAVLESKRQDAEARLQAVEDQLRALAGGDAPLALALPLLRRMRDQDGREQEALRAQLLEGVLAERDEGLLKLLAGEDAALLKRLSAHLAQDRKGRTRQAKSPAWLHLDDDARVDLANLLGGALESARRAFAQLADEAAQLRETLVDLDRKIAAAPLPEAIDVLVQDRQRLRHAVVEAEERLRLANEALSRCDRDIAQQETRLRGKLETDARLQIKDDDGQRMLQYAARMRETMAAFREQVVRRHAGRIEHLVLESFHQLLRKESLITRLAIDPVSFEVTLFGHGNHVLTPERLSAGERQLLAVAMLWGLARASGRPLPAIIDTPMGRLDSVHRYNLIHHYFPHASHQVLLLSTDEEIAGEYHQALLPYVGRSWRLAFDDREGCTRIEPGYFLEKAA